MPFCHLPRHSPNPEHWVTVTLTGNGSSATETYLRRAEDLPVKPCSLFLILTVVAWLFALETHCSVYFCFR